MGRDEEDGARLFSENLTEFQNLNSDKRQGH